ncbi:hypothetical protein SAMD00019534_053980, partial [Acytostelium subglobosum LB1]|uniref:hypothetical protein n=1 Tax=Acytostelium subglobosum LB1 TaxID=1410327 RepID=UPI000644CE13
FKYPQSHEQFYPPNKKLPTITVRDYLHRLYKYSPCSKECFVAALVYIDRLISECGLIVNSFNIHRILITTLVISTKYLDDIFYNNEYYSQVGGIQLREMNHLELDFLKMLNFGAVCPDPVFEEYQSEIEQCRERYQTSKRLTSTSSSSSSSIVISLTSSHSPRHNTSSTSNNSPIFPRRASCDQGSVGRTKSNDPYHTNCA